MYLVGKYIKVKHDKGPLQMGEECLVLRQQTFDTGPFLVSTHDDRKQWLNRSEFILIHGPSDHNPSRHVLLKDEFINFLTEHGYNFYNGSGLLFQDNTCKITILNNRLTVYRWDEGISNSAGWCDIYSVTGYDQMTLAEFKMLMCAFGVVRKKDKDFKTAIEIAEEVYKINENE